MKIRRLARGLTVEQLAVAAGVSAATVSRIENGRVESYRSTRHMLASILECDPVTWEPEDVAA